MQTRGSTLEHTFMIAQRAIELMRAYGPSAHPRSYEVWYTYVSGHKPVMNDAIKRLTAERGLLRDGDIDQIYDEHLSPLRISSDAERTSNSIILEIDEVMQAIGVALGSTAKYGRSLAALTTDLAGPVDRARVREIIGALIAATKDVQSTNGTLEARLKETRGEIESLRETLEAARVEALTDTLTGISNRKHFEDTLVKAVDHAAVADATLTLVVIDIDHFKKFNDLYGHLTGDQVLRLVAMVMREQVRTGATLARFGGEEFGVILPAIDLDAARAVAERIRLSVMNRDLVKRSTGESLGKVTLSIGVAAFSPEDTATSLLERADQCMFLAKRSGRNQTMTDADAAWVETAKVA